MRDGAGQSGTQGGTGVETEGAVALESCQLKDTADLSQVGCIPVASSVGFK